MSSLSHVIRSFNRFELKYLLTLKQAADVRLTLQAYMEADEHGSNGGHYGLTSLYYDSPDLRCYQEKVNGEKFRRKLRLRHYDSAETFTEETPVFVEIKQRVDRVTQKRRAVLPYRQALRLCNDRQMPEHAAQDRQVLEEILVFAWQYNLRPTSLVHYERQALVGMDYDPGLRVTFDTQLAFQVQPLHLHEAINGLSMLPAHLAVMEIKVNERMPTWLTETIRAHNLRLVRVSKYCRSVDAARDLPSMHFSRLRAESADEVLAAVPAVYEKVALASEH